MEKRVNTFISHLAKHDLNLCRKEISTLQINIGKLCNQACNHCHVEAGPKRTENMNKDTIERILLLLDNSPIIKIVDITGGAPELNPNFQYLVDSLRRRKIHVIDRCNLTVLFEEGQQNTAKFLADNQVEIVASLPCYLEDNVNSQRGNGVFTKSIKGLKLLNSLGYGREGGLILNLVYNPQADTLPPEQQQLESDYKSYLLKEYGIVFNNLYTITNMPIKRFAHMLIRQGKYTEYMQLLIDNFNPVAVDNLMCKSMLSISFDGKIYDCDFNQMLEIPVLDDLLTIWDIDKFSKITNKIATAAHCFGCCAGTGSSCGGVLI